MLQNLRLMGSEPQLCLFTVLRRGTYTTEISFSPFRPDLAVASLLFWFLVSTQQPSSLAQPGSSGLAAAQWRLCSGSERLTAARWMSSCALCTCTAPIAALATQCLLLSCCSSGPSGQSLRTLWSPLGTCSWRTGCHLGDGTAGRKCLLPANAAQGHRHVFAFILSPRVKTPVRRLVRVNTSICIPLARATGNSLMLEE